MCDEADIEHGCWSQEFRNAGGAHCGTCHASWSGTRRAHCTQCHQTFESYTSSDAHQVAGGSCIANVAKSKRIKFIQTDSKFDKVWRIDRDTQ